MVTQVERQPYHVHLPKLDDNGFIGFDTDTGAVTLTENAGRIAEPVALVSELEDTAERLEGSTEQSRKRVGTGAVESSDE